MQGLPKLVDRCADDFIGSFDRDWVPDESGAEYDYQYGQAILKTLRDFATAFTAEVRRRIAPRLRQRNTCMTVSKLPPELLQLIFHFNLIISPGNRAPKYTRTMVILRSVSWGWRALLDRSPFLWGHISSSDHPEFISKAFDNSKEASLHLEYSSRGSQSAFLDKMFRHLHRLESIEIHNPTHEVLANYFTSRAPLLKRMVLLARDEWEPHDPVRLFSGSLTFLEELRIQQWGEIGWKEVQFSQLRVVDIGNCGSLEISLILRLVQENQHLEILRLKAITFTSSTSLTHSNTPVVLSHLKDLTLSKLVLVDPGEVNSYPHHPTLLILRHIRFPSCTKLILHTFLESESAVDPEDLPLPSPLDLLAHLPPNDPQTSQTTRRYLTATFSRRGLALTVKQKFGCEFKYELELYRAPRSITLRWLKSALEDRPGVTLHSSELHFYIEEHGHMDDLVAFQGLEAVTLLSVEIADDHLQEKVERLLQILATPCTSASGTTMMAFPRLLTVKFDGWDGRGEAVLEMIRNRFGTPGVEAHRPDVITIYYGFQRQEVRWDSLGDIRGLVGFDAIHFGAIDRWPSRRARSISTVSYMTPSNTGPAPFIIAEDESWAAESQGGWDVAQTWGAQTDDG